MKQEQMKVSANLALNVALEERQRVAEHFVKEVEKHVIEECPESSCKHFQACYNGICGEDCIWWNRIKFTYGIK